MTPERWAEVFQAGADSWPPDVPDSRGSPLSIVLAAMASKLREIAQETSRRKPPLDEGAHNALVQELYRLRVAAGYPSLRVLAAEMGDVSYSTLHDMLTGARVISWPKTEKLIEVLDGDPQQLRPLWLAAKGFTTPGPPPGVSASGGNPGNPEPE